MCAKIDKKLENGNIYTLLDIYKSYFLRKFVMLAFQTSKSCEWSGEKKRFKRIF